MWSIGNEAGRGLKRGNQVSIRRVDGDLDGSGGGVEAVAAVEQIKNRQGGLIVLGPGINGQLAGGEGS